MDDGATLALATEDVRAELRAAVHDARERGLLYSAKWCAPRRFPLLVLLFYCVSFLFFHTIPSVISSVVPSPLAITSWISSPNHELEKQATLPNKMQVNQYT